MIHKFTQSDLMKLAYKSLPDYQFDTLYDAQWSIQVGEPTDKTITLELIEIVPDKGEVDDVLLDTFDHAVPYKGFMKKSE